MPAPNRRLDLGQSIPAGYVIGRTQGGEGDAHLISISDLAGQMASSGLVLAPGSGGSSITVVAGTGIGVSLSGTAYTVSNTGVLSNVAGTGIAVSGATGNVTVSLAAISNLTTLANISGGSAVPSATTWTAWMDAVAGSTQGNITYRNGTVWTVLAPATNVDTREAQVKALVQDGAGQNPKWSAVGHYVWKRTVSAATTAALPACTYSNGTGGIGATLTGNANGAITAQDGVTLDASGNNSLLVKDQADAKQNGVYWVTQAGDGSHPFILTRMEDLNDYTSGGTGMFFPVASGTTQGQTIWMSAIAQTTFGSDNITFSKVAGSGSAGTGVTSIVAGTNVTISSTGAGGTGAVTVNAPNAGAGNYLGRRVISATATYTPTTGTASVNVTIIGGGGAGGGAAATSSVQQAEGSGGGAGGISQKYMTTGFSGVTVTLGAAGASSSGAAGGNGGNSTFGAVLTANGGTGGGLGSATTNTGVAGGAGGTASGGDINVTGSRGWFSSPQLSGGDAISGRGGDSAEWGTGGAEQLASAAGIAASGFGAGGSGAINGASQSARAGGNGAAGVCIIDEYGPSAVIGSSGGGLYSGLLTAPPTIAGGTWTAINSPTGADVTSGVTISDVGFSGIKGYTKTAPGTPYSFSALMALSGITVGGATSGICFSDGTKYQLLHATTTGVVNVDNFNTTTSFNANVASLGAVSPPILMWYRIRDDGTTVYFSVSTDATTWCDIYSIAKASGFLGAGGYTKVGFMFGYNGSGSIKASTTLWSWTQGV